MNIKFVIMSGFISIVGSCENIARAENSVEDYFAMSPAELAAIPVTIASGTPKPIFQSAAVTTVITAE